jgi:hypothetical protein
MGAAAAESWLEGWRLSCCCLGWLKVLKCAAVAVLLLGMRVASWELLKSGDLVQAVQHRMELLAAAGSRLSHHVLTLAAAGSWQSHHVLTLAAAGSWLSHHVLTLAATGSCLS